MSTNAGRLGAADLAAAVDTLLYTAPPNTVATVNVRLSNRTTGAIAVRLAIGTGAAPANADYYDYDTPIPGNGVLAETGIPLSAGEKVWARAATVGISASVRGFEETI